MRWETKSLDVFLYHTWFAWFPVQISTLSKDGYDVTRWAWLEHVGRQAHGHWGGFDWSYMELTSD